MMKDWYASFVLHNDPDAEGWEHNREARLATLLRDHDGVPALMNIEVGNVCPGTPPIGFSGALFSLFRFSPVLAQ